MVMHKGLLYSTFTLFTTIIFLVATASSSGWKMDKPFGIKLIIWYCIVMSIASLYEYV